MPAAKGRLIHPMIIRGFENNGVMANNPRTVSARISTKMRPARWERISLMSCLPGLLMSVFGGPCGLHTPKHQRIVALWPLAVNFSALFHKVAVY